MAYRIVTLQEFIEHEAASSGDSDSTWNGFSPGYVAEQLGITRQAVHHAMKAGTLEAIRCEDHDGQLRFINIPQRAIDSYVENHLGRFQTAEFRERLTA